MNLRELNKVLENPETLLTTADAALMVGGTKASIFRLVRDGKLHAVGVAADRPVAYFRLGDVRKAVAEG